MSIFERAIVLILAYGITAWGHRLIRVNIRAQIRSIQAVYLRAATGAYRSVPNERLLARCLPLHLHLSMLHAKSEPKASGRTQFGTRDYNNRIQILDNSNARIKENCHADVLPLLS